MRKRDRDDHADRVAYESGEGHRGQSLTRTAKLAASRIALRGEASMPARRRTTTSRRRSSGAQKEIPSFFDRLEWRNAGPYRGGRVSAVVGDPNDRNTFYFGSTGGGIWKTQDGGQYWENTTDGFFKRASVGGIGISQSDPNVIYVGMGESCIRGNVSHGDGVYRSTDAGKTWTHLGLDDTCTRATPIPRMSRHSGTRTGATPSAACSDRATVAGRGRRCCIGAMPPAPSISRSIRTIHGSCTRRSGRRSADPGSWSRAARGAGSSARPMAAIPGPRSAATRGFRRERSGRSAYRPRRQSPDGSTRSSKPKTERSSAPTTSVRPGTARARTATFDSVPGTTTTSTLIRPIPRRCGSST